MPARASWKGFLRLSLVSVPVQAFNAANTQTGDVHFHQLHEPCHNRIRYQKVCPVHGEVSNDEIVMGYEYSKGQYVVVDDEELDRLREHSEKAVSIEAFVEAGTIDPKYFDGRTYYLMPDGPGAHKPYAVLLAALTAEKRWGVAKAIISHRDQLVVLRAAEGVLCLEALHYAEQLRGPDVLFGDLELPKVDRQELRLATQLIEASTPKKFDLASYTDEYTTLLRELIDAKVEGKEIVSAPQEEEAPVINLMDALRKSVATTKHGQTKRAVRHPPKRAKARRPHARKSAG